MMTEQSKQQTIIEREKQYLLQNYGRYPLALAKGKGSYVFDFDGKRYLDLLSGIGVNSLGHAHPRMIKILREQASLMIHTSNLYYHEYQGLLAEKIVKTSGLSRAFFCNSGTESVEGALKMARSHGHAISDSKFELVALENSFHGRTFGALSVTGQPKYRAPFEPLLTGVKFAKLNDLASLEAVVSDNTAAIIMETIQGEGGVYPATEAMARKARELCDKHNALLIFDEIQCGVGRVGTHFAYQRFQPSILPDVLVVAKPLAVGLPLAFVACNEKAAATIGAGMHGTTFGGGPLVCRMAAEFFDMLDDLLPQILARGDQFRAGLADLAAKYDFIKEVRVHGLMIGVELKMPGKQLVTDAMEAGLLINCTHDTVLRFLPPYIISEAEVTRALSLLNKVFRKGKAYYKDFKKAERLSR